MEDDDSTFDWTARRPGRSATDLVIDLFPVAMAAVLALFLALRVAD